MRTDDFDYHLPEELIAQTPMPRGEARLLVLHRDSGEIEHRQFADLLQFVRSDDTLVLNDTRVIARRITALRESGLPAEVLILRPVGDLECDALVKPGMRINANLCLDVSGDAGISAQVIAFTEEGGRRLRFRSQTERDQIFRSGEAPLPPYIHSKLAEEERYQTVFGKELGSAAAPTAGLHFTEVLLNHLKSRGMNVASVTLHIGVDTFRPVKVDEIESHVMHGEPYRILEGDADIINRTPGKVFAIGTTSVRVLESAATESSKVRAAQGETRLFIYPGFRFRVVDALLTNFHLPKSTLLMLVSAFAGREKVLSAYREAVHLRYRFFSFGDAMLII